MRKTESQGVQMTWLCLYSWLVEELGFKLISPWCQSPTSCEYIFKEMLFLKKKKNFIKAYEGVRKVKWTTLPKGRQIIH